MDMDGLNEYGNQIDYKIRHWSLMKNSKMIHLSGYAYWHNYISILFPNSVASW